MFKQFTIAVALVVATSSAFAQESTRFYAGADVGSIKGDDADRETGYGGFVGYRFHENFAVEAGYHRLVKVRESYHDAEYGYNVSGKGKTDQADLSLVGTVPLGSGFSVYGRLGVNRLTLKADISITEAGITESESFSESETKLLYGAGLAYAFTPTISGRVEVQKPVSDLTRIAAGVAFSF